MFKRLTVTTTAATLVAAAVAGCSLPIRAPTDLTDKKLYLAEAALELLRGNYATAMELRRRAGSPETLAAASYWYDMDTYMATICSRRSRFHDSEALFRLAARNLARSHEELGEPATQSSIFVSLVAECKADECRQFIKNHTNYSLALEAGRMYESGSNWTQAEENYRKATELCRPDSREYGQILCGLANLFRMQGRLAESAEWAGKLESFTYRTRIVVAQEYLTLARIAAAQQDWKKAVSLFDKAILDQQEPVDPWRMQFIKMERYRAFTHAGRLSAKG